MCGPRFDKEAKVFKGRNSFKGCVVDFYWRKVVEMRL